MFQGFRARCVGRERLRAAVETFGVLALHAAPDIGL